MKKPFSILIFSLCTMTIAMAQTQSKKNSDISMPEGYDMPNSKRVIVEIKPKSVPNAQSLSAYAKAFETPASLPRYSDVVMRSLPVREGVKNNTFTAMDNFHVTRLEWTLSMSDKHIAKVIASGRYFGGMFGSANEDPAAKVYGQLDLAGKNVTLKHHRAWKQVPSVGCMNNPDFLKFQVEEATKYIKAGATSMQRDEPESQTSAYMIGACFCSHCVTKFNKWLSTNISQNDLAANGVTDLKSFNYKQYLIDKKAPVGDDFSKWEGGKLKEWYLKFQSQTNIDYLKSLHEGINKAKGAHYPMSCNNTSFQNWSAAYSFADYGYSEMIMRTAIPERIYERAYVARSQGRLQVYSIPKMIGADVIPEDVRYKTNRRVVATAYAVGSIMSVPWDTYEQTPSGSDRYFGKPEQYADLFGFVRGMTPYLDKYEEVCAMGKNIAEQKLDGKTLVSGLPDKVYAFARAIPNNPKADIVLHLVNWNDNAQDFTLELDKKLITGDKQVKLKLLTPASYSLEKHTQAEAKAQQLRPKGKLFSEKESTAYRELVNTVELPYEIKGDKIVVKMHALQLWSVLVVSKK